MKTDKSNALALFEQQMINSHNGGGALLKQNEVGVSSPVKFANGNGVTQPTRGSRTNFTVIKNN
jgi:hypothetical protein